MDWDKTGGGDDDAKKGTDTIPRKSLDGDYQLPSPEASTTSELPSEYSRKRKASTDSEECPTATIKHGQKEGPVNSQNKSHSIVEKRYRTNLNQKIADLSNCLPSLRADGAAKLDAEKQEPILKHNKATVLTEAITYIKYLERRNAFLERANTALQEQSRRKMSKHIPVQEEVKVEEASASPPVDNAEPPASPVEEEDEEASAEPVEGMIQVPDEWRRLWRGELRPYSSESKDKTSPAEEDDPSVSIRGGKYMGRLMVGSFAGLMVVDGFAATQKESSDDRGLFALPLLRHLPDLSSIRIDSQLSALASSCSSFPYSHLLLPLLRGFLVFGVLGLMLFIYLFNSRPPPRKASTNPTPQPAPSLASPLEVRQRAWLTSIQTVWVPRHHALPEMLALNLETAAYLIRHLLGWHMYSWLTGRSEDEEIARARAWDIAIDAQLSGGDPEISKSRLVLTLWASGTLPSTPARLMLKALHIRVLFWQPSRLPWLTQLLHKAARRLARWQWKKAYRIQRKLEAAKVVELEPLSDHLKALLTRDIDEVMTDRFIQRANNLLWNASVYERSHLEEVMEDTAMRGPLDALASWSSSLKLTATLKAAINSDKIRQDSCILHQLDMATATAPAGCLGKAKALAAKAILCDTERTAHIRQLIQTVAPSPLKEGDLGKIMSSTFMSLVSDVPGTDGHDFAISARCALAMDMLLQQQHSSTYNDPGAATGACKKALQLLEECQLVASKLSLLGFTAIHQLCLAALLRLCRDEEEEEEETEGTSNNNTRHPRTLLPRFIQRQQQDALMARIRNLIRCCSPPNNDNNNNNNGDGCENAAQRVRFDTQTRDLIKVSFERMMMVLLQLVAKREEEEEEEEKTGRRRSNASFSNDTGYDSMSDDDLGAYVRTIK